MAVELPIALDAMGGDIGPSVNVEGAVAAVREDGARVILVGDEKAVLAEIDRLSARPLLESGALSVRHAPEVVLMDDKPAVAVRKKKQSSMRIACDLVENGEGSAALSAGNSGAMMAMALFVFGRVDGVERPCIATPFPSLSPIGMSFLADAGANVDCTPSHLVQFGLMGAVFIEQAHGLANPPIGLVSNGSEDVKGTDLTRAASALFSKAKGIDYKGYVEGNHAADGHVALAITDGFTGNIMLKTAEGSFRFLVDRIKEAYMDGSVFEKLGGALSKSVFNRLKVRFDHREFGGAPLLGLRKPAFISHGSADGYAIRRAIGTARKLGQKDLSKGIEALIAMNAHLFDGARETAAAPVLVEKAS
jgi:glycerol-3-phosphate acyltransferase PlsX